MILPREMLDASWLGFLLGVVSLSLVCVTFQGVRSFLLSPSLCISIPLYVTFSLWSACRGVLQLFTIPSFRSLLSPPRIFSPSTVFTACVLVRSIASPVFCSLRAGSYCGVRSECLWEYEGACDVLQLAGREDVKCWRKGAGDMADGCFISWECDGRLLVTWRELLVWVEGWFPSLPEWDSF